MSSRIGSTIATFILSVPVSGVGLVYGLPYLNQVLESPESDGVVRSPDALNMFRDMVRGQNEGGEAPEYGDLGSSDVSPWEEFPSERIENANNTPSSDWSHEQRHHSDGFSESVIPKPSPSWIEDRNRPLASERRQNTPPQQIPATNHSTPAVPANNPVGTGQQVTSLREAAQILNELGIDQYHLERGSSNESFLFVCLFSPGDAPQITHRFEAEAAEPVIAVNQVLQQVNQWLNSRYAQPPLSTSLGNL